MLSLLKRGTVSARTKILQDLPLSQLTSVRLLSAAKPEHQKPGLLSDRIGLTGAKINHVTHKISLPQADIHTCFEPSTSTWQYVVADPKSSAAAIIDPVLDFDPAPNRISTESADKLLGLVRQNQYVSRILETHAHADHLTSSAYLQRRLVAMGQARPEICIGKRIVDVQSVFSQKYGLNPKTLKNVFDVLLDDEIFHIGGIPVKILHLPGHTPDHIGYQIGENVFTGDSIFNPDVGSARTDFQGGSATDLYKSTRTLLSLPPHYRLYTGHDYAPDTRAASGTGEKCIPYTTVAEQDKLNKHVNASVPEGNLVKWRSERDATLGEPRLLHQALQFNIRAGRLPATARDGSMLLHVPLKLSKSAAACMKL